MPAPRKTDRLLEAEIAKSAERYTIARVDNRAWGGVQWAIWDNVRSTWADDLGRYLNADAATRAAQAANEEPPRGSEGWR